MDNCVYGPLIEEWRDVPDFEGFYKVSNYGLVRVLSRVIKGRTRNGLDTVKIAPEKVLTKVIDETGYVTVCLLSDKFKKTRRVHVFQGMAFLQQNTDKPKINHKNSIKDDNFILNFEYTTQRENACHSLINRLSVDGNTHLIGVSKHRKTGKFMSRIEINGRAKYLGLFPTEIDASNAYKEALLNNGLQNKYT